ncbi:hypothetical protein PENTCL1PPCAC_10643, partial [Pristionchus entomophagus]
STGSSLFTTSKEWSPLEFVPSSTFSRSKSPTPTTRLLLAGPPWPYARPSDWLIGDARHHLQETKTHKSSV